VISKQEDETYDNLDQQEQGETTDAEKLLRKAKIDCLNYLSLGANSSKIELAKCFKVLSL
jgi:hypothetical protein